MKVYNMTWKFKNELEYDWCYAALNCVRNELKQMNNARWLIYAQKADSFLETIVRFIRFSSLQLEIEFPITVMVDEPAFPAASEAFPFASVRNIALQRNPVEAEYCVYCGYDAQTDLFQTEAQRRHTLQNLTVFWQQIARPSRRSICISSSKVYSAYPYPIAAAECEFLQEPASADCLFAREAERLACESQHSYVVLRPGIILGTGLIDSPVSDVLNR